MLAKQPMEVAGSFIPNHCRGLCHGKPRVRKQLVGAKHALFANELQEGLYALRVKQPREVGGVVREALGQPLERDALGMRGYFGEQQGDKVVGASASGRSANRGTCQRDGR